MLGVGIDERRIQGRKGGDSLADREVALRHVADGRHDRPARASNTLFYTYTLAHACRHELLSAVSHVPASEALFPDEYMTVSS